jgi:hypothetical protein
MNNSTGSESSEEEEGTARQEGEREANAQALEEEGGIRRGGRQAWYSKNW